MLQQRIQGLAVVSALAVTASAIAGEFVLLDESRSTAAIISSQCEGTEDVYDYANGFGFFSSELHLDQICDDIGIVIISEASQESSISTESIGGTGRAFTSAESPTKIIAYSWSRVDATFVLTETSQYTAVGELAVAWGLPGGHGSVFQLSNAANKVLLEIDLLGDGGAPTTKPLAVSGLLGPGEYTLLVAGSISPADLLTKIPFAEATFDFEFGVRRPGDVDDDGAVTVNDLLALLSAWGPCPADELCVADINGDGTVGILDLLTLLAHWG